MANILIVDDSKFMRKMLSDILTEGGHHIVGEAENAKEATELYKIIKPDLVTLDIIMPEVEGIDAISALKEMIHVNSNARVVMVSAMGQEQVVEECMQAGAKDFIVKPFQPSDVAVVVKKVLGEVGLKLETKSSKLEIV
jgi:two-component system chemotaxis response regulator CheY